MKRPAGLFTLALGTVLVVLSACGGDDPSPIPTPTGPAAETATATPEATPTPDETSPSPAPASPTTAPSPSPTATPEPTSSLESLSLVYVDTRRGQGGDIYVADADGANPRLVLSEASYRRPLDVMGGTLAAVNDGGLLLIDLSSGNMHAIEEDALVFSGRFFDDETFFYSSSSGCSSPGGAVYRVDLPGFETTELFSSDLSLTLVGHEVATNRLAVLPRGCDVGIGGIDVYDAGSGELTNSLAVEGCGWALVALEHAKAVTSWQSCTPPEGHADADVTVYDFGIVGPTGSDVGVPAVEPNAAIWMLRPGHPQAAFGTSTTLGAGPGSTRSGGIYVLHLDSRQFRQLVDGEGAEQYPVAWSPDGRYLLYATVEAQGLCSYAYVDAEQNNPDPVPINDEITFCGLNGSVVGWTQLPR